MNSIAFLHSFVWIGKYISTEEINECLINFLHIYEFIQELIFKTHSNRVTSNNIRYLMLKLRQKSKD